jgi:hypothetical protein
MWPMGLLFKKYIYYLMDFSKLFNVLYYNMNIDKNFGQRNFVMPVT